MSKKELELLRQKIADLFGKNPEEASRKAALVIEGWLKKDAQKVSSPKVKGAPSAGAADDSTKFRHSSTVKNRKKAA